MLQALIIEHRNERIVSVSNHRSQTDFLNPMRRNKMCNHLQAGKGPNSPTPWKLSCLNSPLF